MGKKGIISSCNTNWWMMGKKSVCSKFGILWEWKRRRPSRSLRLWTFFMSTVVLNGVVLSPDYVTLFSVLFSLSLSSSIGAAALSFVYIRRGRKKAWQVAIIRCWFYTPPDVHYVIRTSRCTRWNLKIREENSSAVVLVGFSGSNVLSFFQIICRKKSNLMHYTCIQE